MLSGQACRAALLTALSAPALFSQTPAPVKPPVQGVISMGAIQFIDDNDGTPDNSISDIAAVPGVFSAVVINVGWWQLQPTQGSLDTSVIDSALATVRAYNTAVSQPLRVKLRVWPGANAPVWVKNLGGAPVTVIRNQTTKQITIGRFWSPPYRQAWISLQTQLAAIYDSEPLIAEVTNASCANQTDEPFITAGDSLSIDNEHAAGMTDALYQQCLTDSIDDYAGWTTTRIDFAFSPYKNTDGNGTQTSSNLPFTFQVMQAFRSALGARAVLSQHSMNNPVDPTVAPIYQQMQSMGPLIEFQTHSPDGLDWNGAIQNAIGYGAGAVELWNGATGFPQFSAAVLQGWATALKNNYQWTGPALVSAASLSPGFVAPASLVTIFGSGLSSTSGSTTVTVRDSSGTQQPVTTLYASPTQINAVLPSPMAGGLAELSVVPASGAAMSAILNASPVAPGIFSANANGTGVAAADVTIQHADGSIVNDVAFACPGTGPCTTKPIVMAAGDTVYLILFGTGFRNRSSLANTSVSFNGTAVTPVYAGPQNTFAGLDQLNVVIPASLAGAGTVNVNMSADGIESNTVTIQIQ